MINNWQNSLEYFKKTLPIPTFTGSKPILNIENNPDFVFYDTTDILPDEQNKKHFASLASILSIENGYFGTRSCLEECYCDVSSGATYIAGIYMVNDDLTTDKLAVMPDWSRTIIYIDDESFDMFNQEIISHKRYFDIKRGVTVREFRAKDKKGRITRLRTEKFASLSNKHLGGIKISILPENYSGKITVQTGIDANVVNVDDASFRNAIWNDSLSVLVNIPEKKYKDGNVECAKQVAITQKCMINNTKIIHERRSGTEDEYAFEEFDIKAEAGKEITVNKIVSIQTSLDADEPLAKSYQQISKIRGNFYEIVLNEHMERMCCRLDDSGVLICGDNASQRYANYAVARLIMAGENNCETSSITARTLTGPSYAGHVFWDTDIFDLPFFTFCNPETARTMLMYRYNTLDGARENRKIENITCGTDYKGARFAWESTASGIERTPMFVNGPNGDKIRIFTGTNEKHITPNVAYATYKYWIATADDEFLYKYGAEVIFETARYSRSILEEELDGKLHTKNVIGPDEYHEECEINPKNGEKEGVHDNAYTNVLIQHNLDIAIKTAEHLNINSRRDYQRLQRQIGLDENEIKDWKNAKNRIYIKQDENTGVIEQFEGFDKLKNADLDYFKQKYGEINAQKFDQVLKIECCQNTEIDPDKNNYNVLKQPDVLMLMTLFPEKYPIEVIKANYEKYEPLTSHGSSLSVAIHSLIASNIGSKDDAYRYYLEAGGMDINDKMGNAANGIHAATLGGTWMALVNGFGGMQLRKNCLLFNPNIPDNWNIYKFNTKRHAQNIEATVRKDFNGQEKLILKVGNAKTIAIPVAVGQDEIRDLLPGRTYSAIKTSEGWQWDENINKTSPLLELGRAIASKIGFAFSE